MPLVLGPAPPSHVAVTSTARGVVVDWIPPLAEVGAAPIVFNVYTAAAPKVALNRPAVSGVEYLHSDAPFDEEVCLVVRSVQTVQRVPVESEPSAPVCVTPRDTYPPAAPQGLRAAAVAEGISLSWDANTEPDLAGYVVLRGETPDGTLQPLTPEPIRVTTYRDTTVEPGVRYVYALVAVDTASPPNTSAQSAPQDVIAR